MAYKWKPSASQRKAFAEKMKDPEEKSAYEENKRNKNTYSDNPLSFKHKSFIPTNLQYNEAMKFLGMVGLTYKQQDACNQITSTYVCQDKCHHDYIHIINALSRGSQKIGDDTDN